ncbi:MAG: spore germination protein GerW family protein [Egibacteraceae bacterium]
MDFTDMARDVRDALTVSRVFGDPYERGSITVIPVASVRGAAGGGGGEGEGPSGKPQEGKGGGFALAAKPAGVYVIDGQSVRWRPALNLNRVILGGQTVAVVALLVLRRLLKGRRSSGGGHRTRRSRAA